MRTLTVATATMLSCLICCGRAQADGGFIPAEKGTANSADQRAVIVARGNTETLILETAYDGDSSDFAWVVPVPAIVQGADIATADPTIFDELYELTEPRAWVTTGGAGGCGCGGGGLGGTQDGELAGVNVWERLRVDDFEVAVLSAQQSSDLQTWLNDNGYSFPEGHDSTLDYYVSKGWHFVAFKIAPAKEAPSATAIGPAAANSLDPIQITFPIEAGRPVYPMRISQVSSGRETEVLLYVISRHRMRSSSYATAEIDASSYPAGQSFRAWYDARFRQAIRDAGGRAVIVEYAGQVPGWLAQGALQGLLDDSDYFLTRLRTYLTPEQMTDDVELIAAATDELFEVSITAARLAKLRTGVGIGALLIALVELSGSRSRRRRYARLMALAGLLLLMV